MDKKPVNTAMHCTELLKGFSFLSHVPVLTAACTITTGPVLELGAGFGSTFALHGICGVTGRDILTLEHDKTWLTAFGYYMRSWHKFKHVKSFVGLPEYTDREWGMAFVDHGIFGERGLALAEVRHIPIIVCHDTCYELLNYTNDGFPQVLDSFKYRFDHQWQGPQTSILSDTVDIVSIFKEFGL